MKKLLLTTSLLLATTAACATATNTPTNTATGNRTANAQTANITTDHAAHQQSDHSGMNHDAMMHDHANMKSAPNAAGAPYDLQFLDTMIAHHQGAVDMAVPAVQKSERAELKAFATKIVADQNREIAQMKEWREKWYAGKPSALNMEMPGMTDSMRGMDMTKLDAASGNQYDLMFVEQMIPHHQGAVVMSREALGRAEHSELKTLANTIIKEQTAEIARMNVWQKAWK